MASISLSDRVRDVVATTLGLDVAIIGPEASDQTLSVWSSLAHLRLIANLERTFGVRFTMNEVRTMHSVQAIEQVLAARGVEA
jgi:acyl carrier protein